MPVKHVTVNPETVTEDVTVIPETVTEDVTVTPSDNNTDMMQANVVTDESVLKLLQRIKDEYAEMCDGVESLYNDISRITVLDPLDAFDEQVECVLHIQSRASELAFILDNFDVSLLMDNAEMHILSALRDALTVRAALSRITSVFFGRVRGGLDLMQDFREFLAK